MRAGSASCSSSRMRASRSACAGEGTCWRWGAYAPKDRATCCATTLRSDISILAASSAHQEHLRALRRTPAAPTVRERVCGFMNDPDSTSRRRADMRTITRRELLTRRAVLKGSAAAGLVVGVPGMLSAQAKAPINIGTLCPLTGAGGSYGPDLQRAVVAVVERINKAGGIHGRPVQLFHEDDQTSAEAGVRAARKLIDVNKVVAIVSTWASAVTLAVRPLCVEAQVFLIGVSGADAVTQGEHKGYVARTQPNTKLQGSMYAKFVVSKKEWKRVAYLALQTPYARSFGDAFNGILRAAGVTITDDLIYEDKKPSYRSEVTRILATNPDLVMLEA